MDIRNSLKLLGIAVLFVGAQQAVAAAPKEVVDAAAAVIGKKKKRNPFALPYVQAAFNKQMFKAFGGYVVAHNKQ
jgi:hypothetical protein